MITLSSNNTDNIRTKRTTTTKTREQKWEENNYMDISSDKQRKTHTWVWLRKRNFKRATESLRIAVHNVFIRINYIKVKIDQIQQNSKCRLYGDKDETINHISNWSKLAQKKYKTKHDWMWKVIHWELC